jgi:hypothetical protein
MSSRQRQEVPLGHPLTLAQTLCFAALIYMFRRDPSAVADFAGRALKICEEQRIAQYHAYAICADGWALGVSGESGKGLAQIAQGVGGYGAAGLPILLALQADAQLATGKPEAALASVAAGLKAVEKTGGAPLEAELHRLRGEALLAGAGTMSEAETAIEKGIDVARQQNAKSWELRGAMSLARLRRQQSRPQEAAALLAPILGWFTEGLDTADLKDAKALLDKRPSPRLPRRGKVPQNQRLHGALRRRLRVVAATLGSMRRSPVPNVRLPVAPAIRWRDHEGRFRVDGGRWFQGREGPRRLKLGHYPSRHR